MIPNYYFITGSSTIWLYLWNFTLFFTYNILKPVFIIVKNSSMEIKVQVKRNPKVKII